MQAPGLKTSPTYRFARRVSGLELSAVREILKVAEHPDIISFAGGLPAPELFPVDEIGRAQATVFAQDGRAAMQYSTTEGWLPLRSWIASRLQQLGVDTDPNRTLIISGSQQGIDLVAKVFVDPGDAVIVDSPSYLAALQTFGAYEAKLIGVGSDQFGMKVDELESALAAHAPKLIYLNSQFQNPTGATLSSERRDQILAVSKHFGVLILEDDPYGELRYDGQATPPLAARDTAGLVIYLSTFSKTLAPGLRIGWLSASSEITKALVTGKQSSDLHTSTVLQHAVAKLLEDFDYDGHVERIRSVYRERRDAMLDALDRFFPPGSRWTRPEGGMFVWVELPEALRAESILDQALEAGVAFVPGAPFFAQSPKHNSMRLNFSNEPPEVIEEGIGRLGRLLRQAAGR